jgi:hypothetical protein
MRHRGKSSWIPRLPFGGIAAWIWDFNEDRVRWTGNVRAVFERNSSEIDTYLKFSNFNQRSRLRLPVPDSSSAR